MEKGFTLIELLAVITILAILATITIFATGNIISNSKQNLLETQIKSIENAAEVYYIEEGMVLNVTCVNVSTLIENGYIDANEIKNPKTKKQMNGSVLIENNYYEYQTNLCE